MKTKTISDWAQSRYGFYVDRQYNGSKWVLQPGPIRLAPYHKDLLDHLFTPGADGRLPYDTVGWCEPAKSGKSAIAGLVGEYFALHLDSNSSIVMASNKQGQAASLMFKSLTDSTDLNPHLPNVNPGKFEVTFRVSGNTVKAIASNSKGEAGARFSLAIFDELWGYVYEDAIRLWNEFKTDPTRLHSIRFAIGYAGYEDESDLWLNLLNRGLAGDPVLEHIRNPGGNPACWRSGRHFVFWSHQTRQPWQTPEWIDSQRKSLRDADYRRMILTEFAGSVGGFVEQDAWEACISLEHGPLPPGAHIERIAEIQKPAYPVYIGLDLATAPNGDDCALIGVYPDGKRVKLAFHQVWRGKERKQRLKLSETVKPFLLQANEDYRLAGVWFDPYQALHLADELRAEGIPCYEVNQTHASRGPKDTALWQMIADRELILYDDPEIRKAASGASAKELGNGMLFLTKGSTRAKIDLMVALSNCADEARYRQPTIAHVY